jgi:hypothetical protein
MGLPMFWQWVECLSDGFAKVLAIELVGGTTFLQLFYNCVTFGVVSFGNFGQLFDKVCYNVLNFFLTTL